MTVKFWETWMGNPGAVAAVATPASSAVALRMVLLDDAKNEGACAASLIRVLDLRKLQEPGGCFVAKGLIPSTRSDSSRCRS